VCEDAELEVVFADEERGARLPDSVEVVPLVCEAAGARECVEPEPGEAALVVYTSGSTGRPKGVLLSHDSQWAMVDRIGVPPGVAGVVAAPLYHMNGLLSAFSLLNARSRLVLMPRFEARAYLEALETYKVNVATGVPTMLALMAKERDLIERLDLSGVFLVSIGSAPLTETVVRQAREMFPNAQLVNGYGTTEAGAGMFGPHPRGLETPTMSVGHPADHVEVRLVGGTGDEGVLQVRTPSAMTGYLNLPEKTAEKLSPEGWIDTGDIVRRDADGFYYFVGRADDMFVCGGENVYPGHVERVLESHPAVSEACVVPVPDEVRGQMPVAFVAVAPGAELSEDEVKQVALGGAPAYMHPRRVYFLDVMPLAGTNKIDRRALTAEAEARR
jgi:acyl-CoA synthetase (AMP-forming)/AMP-acid ligase II